MYELQQSTWPTPNGRPYRSWWRAGTNDWNTINSCTAADEYELRDVSLTGWALDVGAYLGSVAVPLLVDNPGLRVIAIEPVPENARLVRQNAELNGVLDRLLVLEAVAGAPNEVTGSVAWGWSPPSAELAETFSHHRFVGGSTLAIGSDTPHEEVEVPSHSIGSLLQLVGAERFAFMKIDCEGCEAKFLTDPAVALVERIIGEWHPPYIDEPTIHALLDDTHVVETGGPGPGWFRAIAR